jgi:hypothetical protein
LPLYNLDAQTFLLTAHHMDRFELAALYTLQYGLARDPKREHCVADGKEVLPGILAESRFDVIRQPNAPRGAGRQLLTSNYSIVEQTMQGQTSWA